jgi:outer membrane autotransporter protein
MRFPACRDRAAQGGKSKTTFSSADGPVPFPADLGGTSVEFNVGVTVQFTCALSLFASAGYQADFRVTRRPTKVAPAFASHGRGA